MSFKISYIYDLVDKISPKLNKITNNIKEVSSVAKSSAGKAIVAFDKLGNKLNHIGKKTRNLGKDLFLKLTVPIVGIGTMFVNAASDYNESLNKVDVAFGNSAKSIKEFAKTAGKSFGIDRGRALDMAALFGDMSTSMGLSQAKAAELSTSLVGLSGDLASFKNIDVAQATTALSGVFTGETESLKRLGIVMTQQNLQQFAMSKGIMKNISDFTQAEKVILRYQYVTEQSRNSVGDFLRTNEGFANQMRSMQSALKDLAIDFGTIILPYVTKLVSKVSELLQQFQALSPRTKKLILIFAGVAAILSPLLILVGLIASGIGALATTFAVLISPIGLISAAIAGLSALFVVFYDEVSKIASGLSTVLGIPIYGLIYIFQSFTKSVSETIDWVIDYLSGIGGKIYDALSAPFLNAVDKIKGSFASVKDFLGFGDGNLGTANIATVNRTEIAAGGSLAQPQKFEAGGQLDINFKNAPQGMSSMYKPAKKNNLPTYVNSVYAGS